MSTDVWYPGTDDPEPECQRRGQGYRHVPGYDQKGRTAHSAAVERGEGRLSVDGEARRRHHDDHERAKLGGVRAEARNRIGWSRWRRDYSHAARGMLRQFRQLVGEDRNAEAEENEWGDQGDEPPGAPEP
jgi:hypothetical protein